MRSAMQRTTMALSLRRAQSVASWLGRRRVMNAYQIVTFGFGKSRPVAANRRPDGKDDPEGAR